MLVGAPGKGVGGVAYVFDGASGTLLQAVVNPDPTTGDAFGKAVALAGNTAVVGAPLDDPDGKVNAGAVHQFDAATGALVRTLSSPRHATFEQFGAAVATDGARIVVGAPFDGTERVNENETAGFGIHCSRDSISAGPSACLGRVTWKSGIEMC